MKRQQNQGTVWFLFVPLWCAVLAGTGSLFWFPASAVPPSTPHHTTPAAWDRPPSEAVSPSAGSDLSAPPRSWVCDHHCRPSRAGLWHSLWPVPCRAHSCLGRGRPDVSSYIYPNILLLQEPRVSHPAAGFLTRVASRSSL